MKLFTNILFSFFTFFSVLAQFNPEPKKVTELFFPENETIENVTPALLKKKGFTNYEDLIAFLETQKNKFPDLIKINYLGKSQKGYEIPIVFIQNQKSKEEKVKVFLQGGLHGDEPASTEGVLYLMYQLLNNEKYQYLLNRLEFAIIPMANIDGFLKQERNATNGLDLNRDQTKLMAPESILLKQAFSNYNPEVALDFHEYNAYRRDFAKMGTFGITSAYDVMFLYSSNHNVNENIRTVIDTIFVENARKKLNENQLRHNDYMSTETYSGEIQFNKGSVNARSSATSFALTNTIAALIEIRGVNLGRTSFKRRINSTFLIGLSFLETAYHEHQLVKETIKNSQNSNQKIIVTTKKRIYKEEIDAIDLDNFSLIKLPITTRDSKNSEPKLIREKPLAYYLQKDQIELVEKLKILGLQMEILDKTTTLMVETYQIIKYEKETTTYEKMNLQNVETQMVVKEITLPVGSFKILCNQKNAALLYETLEPEASSSFVSMGVLKTELNQELPIYRQLKTL